MGKWRGGLWKDLKKMNSIWKNEFNPAGKRSDHTFVGRQDYAADRSLAISPSVSVVEGGGCSHNAIGC